MKETELSRQELKNDLKQRYSKGVDWANPSMGENFLNVGVINGLGLVDGFSHFPLANIFDSFEQIPDTIKGMSYAATLMVASIALINGAKHMIQKNRLNRDIDAFLKSELG